MHAFLRCSRRRRQLQSQINIRIVSNGCQVYSAVWGLRHDHDHRHCTRVKQKRPSSYAFLPRFEFDIATVLRSGSFAFLCPCNLYRQISRPARVQVYPALSRGKRATTLGPRRPAKTKGQTIGQCRRLLLGIETNREPKCKRASRSRHFGLGSNAAGVR